MGGVLDLQRLLDEERITPGIFKDDINTIKAHLEKIDEEPYKGAIVRARAEKLLVRETPTKRAFALEKKYASGNQIGEIEYQGAVTGNRDLIKQAFVEFYQKLFGRKTPKEKGFDHEFLPTLPKLDSDTGQFLEEPISVTEIERAIDELCNRKSPGSKRSIL